MDTENNILQKALQNVLDLAPGGIVIVDETNAIVLCNHYFAHTICKKNKKSIINQNITQSTLLPDEIKKILIFDEEFSSTSQQVKQCSFKYSLPENTVVYFRIIKTHFNTEEKNLILLYLWILPNR